MSRVSRAALVAILAAFGCASSDGPYPSKEIKLVVQASPGGLSDLVSRVMASLIEDGLGVPVVCENKPGASGALAFSFVARRPPDGYTIGHAPVEIAMVRSLGFADLGPEDVTLICLVSKTPPVLVVQSDSPLKSLEAFIAAAERRPGATLMANGGTGSIWHFNAMLLEERADIRVTHVPYPGAAPALTALLGGHVDAVIAGVGEVVSHVQSGALRPLAVFDEARSEVFPDVPTTHELGRPMGAPAWSGFFGPAGIPEATVARLSEDFRKGFESDEWRKLCRERGMTPLFLDRREFRTFALEQATFFGTELPKLLRMER